MNFNRERATEILLVVGFCAFLFFYHLGAFGLVGADEPRYAQVAREMLSRHDWVTPILNGVPWLEKPILYYWGAMLSYSVFGVVDWAARVPTAALATLMIAAVYLFASRFRPGMRLDAALMTASGAMVFAMARAASTDMPLTACFTISLLAWFAWYASGNRAYLLAFYAVNAAAMLAKGPVAPVLAAVIICVFSFAVRRPKLILQSLWIPGIVAFIAVAAPWYVLVQLRTPQFARVFFLQQNLARFGTNLYHHKQPFWYYLPVALLATVPWVALVIASVVGVIVEWKAQSWRARDGEDALPTFLLIWAAVPLLFFSASTSKLPAYILPAIPPLLLLAADWMHRRVDEDSRLPLWLAAAHAVIVAILAGVTVMSSTWFLKRPANSQLLITASMAGAIVFLGAAIMLAVRGWQFMRFVTLAPLILCLGFILRTQSPIVDHTQSSRPLAEMIGALGYPADQDVALFGTKRELEYGLMFYRDRHVRVYAPLEPNQPETVGIPEKMHLVIIREGMRDKLAAALPGRNIAFAGYYRPQHLELYAVGAQH
ncbi:MAG TPA: glycosyltransferase family 39 protein [Terriglobales bacterium]